jgi:hypothetical protein
MSSRQNIAGKLGIFLSGCALGALAVWAWSGEALPPGSTENPFATADGVQVDVEPAGEAGIESPATELLYPPPTRAGGTSPVRRSPVVTPLAAAESLAVLKKKPLYEFNEQEVDAYLGHLFETEPDPVKRLLHLARKNLGQPYEIYLLGEFPYETHDPDPMYCLEKSDCVTFSEHTYAMAFSRGWGSFFRLLQRLRYKDGQVGMLTRNHETICDWNRNNAWLLEDVTRQLGGKSCTAMNVTWRPSRFFSQFGIGNDLPDVKVNEVYISRKNMARMLGELKDGDFVNVIRGSGSARWCGHVGIIAHSPKGDVHLIHSTTPAVREERLTEYMARNRSVLGFKFLRLRSDPQVVVDAEMGEGLPVVDSSDRR